MAEARSRKAAKAAPEKSAADAVPASALLRRLYEAGALFLLFAAGFLVTCLVTFTPGDPSFNHATAFATVQNGAGVVGAYTSDLLLGYFGGAAFTVPGVLLFWAFSLFMHQPVTHLSLRLATLPILISALGALFFLTNPFPGWPTLDGAGNGGLIGMFVGHVLRDWLGMFGALFLPMILALLSFLWLTNLSTHDLMRLGTQLNVRLMQLSRLVMRVAHDLKPAEQMEIDLPVPAKPKASKKPAPPVERVIAEPRPAKRIESEKQSPLPLNLSDAYVLPPLHLLAEGKNDGIIDSESALTQNARQIEAQLANFNVDGQVVKICPGPVITIYEFEPAPGIKTSQVIGLADDLARAMSAVSVRVAAIPGKNVIGIELPNAKRRTVTLREMLATEEFETHPGKLTVALGVDSAGQPVYTDISKMPHALIAGTTGSGKSVAMNAFILSLAYRMTPKDLRFIMIDPKMLELSIYNDIPHLMTPVVTDPMKAAAALKWAVKEMENRYRTMSELGVKNIQSFNAKFAELQAAGKVPTRLVQTGFDPHNGQPIMEEKPLATEAFPYIVVVIDELADLMMVAGKQVETSIARLAQMARASGIHLLVATQRPSVDVVTGLIKANIPTRISFHVTSKIDSRTVLDQMGAEQLLGKGDMLFMANGAPHLQRIHGAFVSEEECTGVAEHLKSQGKPTYITSITKDSEGAGNGNGGEGEGGEDDPLYARAIEVVAREQKASTSFIQRHLQIGYNRAARLIDRMEMEGLISAPDHVGKREVIVRKPPAEGYGT
jgi:S-DNA-T family DNA segregation ATPase FtsK/SpoIIIE